MNDASPAASQTVPGTAFTFYITVTFCLFATHLDIYLHETGKLPISLILLFVAWASVLVVAIILPDFNRLLTRCLVATANAAWPVTFFVFWIAIHLARMPDSLPVSDDINYSLYLPFFPFMVLLFGIGLGAADGCERALRIAAAVAFLLLSATIAADAIVPGTFGVLNSRAAGLPMNANVAAFNLVLLLAAAVRYDTLGRRDVGLIALGLIIVALTLSRGGMLLFVAFVVGYLYLLLRASDLLRGLKSLAVLVALGAATYLCLDWIAVSLPLFDVATVPERFDQIMLRSEYVGDDDVRFAMLSFYLGLIARQPLLGYGAGFSLSGVPGAPDDGAGPHNMYLRAWVDLGLLGPVAYIGLLVAIWLTLRRARLAVGTMLVMLVACNGFLSHDITENKAVLLLLGIVLGIAGVRRLQAGTPVEDEAYAALVVPSAAAHPRGR